VTVYISLLRGINVGGNKRIRMDALRAIYESVGLAEPKTLLQSGNVVFKSDETDRAALTKRIEAGIEQGAGFHSDIILRTLDEWRGVIARNPFPDERGLDGSRVLVTFMARTPDAKVVELVRQANPGPEEVFVSGDEIYVYFPDGMGKSKLAAAMVEKNLKATGSGRNWNTVLSLLTLAESV
jgi:uncharacterized protein (DUF1697 family)